MLCNILEKIKEDKGFIIEFDTMNDYINGLIKNNNKVTVTINNITIPLLICFLCLSLVFISFIILSSFTWVVILLNFSKSKFIFSFPLELSKLILYNISLSLIISLVTLLYSFFNENRHKL